MNLRALFCELRSVEDTVERIRLIDERLADDETSRQRLLELFTAAQLPAINPLDRIGQALGATAGFPQISEADWHPLDSESDLHFPPYRLIEQIGEGGMGVVFMAWQQQPIRRMVAVKLIKPGMDSKPIIARFEAERQALAMLNHPHIAKVLDAGTSPAGSPYFVMDLVRGIPITEYSDRHNLGLQERLELFANVCDAVHHAHQKGIIHRDLKPSNILVELDDVRPVPKVIDFGVAKSLHQPLGDSTLVTGLSQMIGTPLYMSPEQAQLNSFDVDVRSDVYSLGVVLYELLTSRLPFERETLKKVGLDEFRRVIREDAPPRPSTCKSTLNNKRSSTVSEARPTFSRHVSLMMRRELDWIVLKSLEKDRIRRYQSAQDFSDDIRRFLNDERVLACPPSWRYRWGKWAKHHKGLLSAGVMLLAAASIFSLLLWNERLLTLAALGGEREQRIVAEEQRQMAKDQELLALEREAAAIESRRRAQKNQYSAEIVSGQVDWQRGYLKRLESKLQGHLPVGDQHDRRGWEWYYLWSVGHPEVRTLFASAAQTFATWSPDGRYIGSSGDIWEAATGQSPRRLDPTYILRYRSAWSPDSQYFAWGTASDDNCVYLWNRETDELHELRGHTESVWCLDWSPDGKQLISGGIDKTLHIWDIARREVVRSVQVPNYVSDVAFSPDGDLIAACVKFKGVLVWQGDSGELLTELDVGPGEPNEVQLSWQPDGRQLAVSTTQAWLLFRRDDWSSIRKVELPFQRGRDIAWSPDGTRLAVADGQILSVWDPSASKPERTLAGHTAPILNVDWSPTGQQLVSSDNLGSVKIWDLNSPSNPTLTSVNAPLQSLAWSGDSYNLSVAHTDGSTSTWNLLDGSQITRTASMEFDGESLWSPDRKRLAKYSDTDPTVVRIHAGEGQTVLAICRLESVGKITHMAWSNDGKKLAVAQQLKGRVSITLWEVDSEKRISQWSYVGPVGVGDEASIYSLKLVWSPDRQHLAVGALGEMGDNGLPIWQGHIYIVNAQSGATELKHNVGGRTHRAPVRSMAWRPDGRAIVAGTHQGLMEAVLVNTGAILFSYPLNSTSIRSLSWNSDGDRIAAAADDGSVRVLDASSGDDLLTFSLDGQPHHVSWSPNGRRLAAATSTGQIQVWDATPAYAWAENRDRRGELARSYAFAAISGEGPSERESRLQKVLELAPDTLDGWMLRGNVRAELGDFEGAAAEYYKVINRDRKRSVSATYNYGIALLGAGQFETFREHCSALLNDLEGSAQNHSVERNFIQLCILTPYAGINAEIPTQLARDFVESYGASNAPAKLLLGTSLYRAGKFQEAESSLAEAAAQLERQGNPAERPDLANALCVLAMTRQQLGHSFQAQRLLEQSLDIAQKLPTDINWPILVSLQVLQREALGLIQHGPVGREKQTTKASR